MRHLIIADIHANLAAFQAVLSDAQQRGGFDSIWCLGDIVGYGPEPHECIDLLQKFRNLCVAGNHDLAAAGKIDTRNFNHDAAVANRWTSQQLTHEDITYLGSLPLQLIKDPFTFVHGSPRQPIWEYVVSPDGAIASFAILQTPYCFVGHSHAAIAFKQSAENHCTGHRLSHGERIVLSKQRLIINPGGVGQPRDGDPRAAYAMYDESTQTVICYRVEYNIAATQEKMRMANLPTPLIYRLDDGW